MEVLRKEKAEALLSAFGEVREVNIHLMVFGIIMEVLYLDFEDFAVSKKTIEGESRPTLATKLLKDVIR